MGTSTDAVLVFGISVPDDSEAHDRLTEIWDDDEGFEKFEALEKKTGAEIVQHCSADVTMFILSAGPGFVANRGYPKAVGLSLLKITNKHLASIRKLCEEIGMPFADKNCRWWLASYWG